MKRMLLTAGLIMSLLLCGCASEQSKSESEQTEPPAETVNAVKEIKKIDVNSAPKDVGDWEPLGRYSIDITGDGEDDMITLYTSAQRDMSGEIMWDDTQEWVLQAETAEGVYDLYDERIHGNAYMNIADFYNEDGDIKVISLIIAGNSFNEIREYSYNGKEFEEKIAYSTDDTSSEGINSVYSSIPLYE